MGEPVYEVVWPLGRSAYDTLPLAPRGPDLRGKTVCELWDRIFRGEKIFPLLRESLSKQFPGIKFVDYTSFGNTTGPKQREVIATLPDLLRRHNCDAVISGVGG
ncbi:MAG: hypothetical protein HYX92_03120 [Chloroflexi bacterium]|nr:hypothetical protein [Chloroflexota bacterium]